MSLRVSQRGDLGEYGIGLQDLFAGCYTDDANAAARNLAEVFILARSYFTGEK